MTECCNTTMHAAAKYTEMGLLMICEWCAGCGARAYSVYDPYGMYLTTEFYPHEERHTEAALVAAGAWRSWDTDGVLDVRD